MLKNIKRLDISQIIDEIKKITELSLGIQEFLDYLYLWYKDIAFCKATGSTKGLLYAQEEYTIAQIAKDMSFEGIQKVITEIEKTKKHEKANVNMDISLELLLLTIKEN